MKVIGKERLDTYSRKHADVRSRIASWLYEAEEAEWRTPNDIKKRYADVSFLANKVIVFNLKGKKYRLVTKVDFKSQVVLIKKIGTHAEYNRWKLKGG